MRKDPPGLIAQMKIMLAGLDQIKHTSRIREQQREGREQCLLESLDEGHTPTGYDVGKGRSGQRITVKFVLHTNIKTACFFIPCVMDTHTMSSYLYQRDKQRK
jgi:hypothetical protein